MPLMLTIFHGEPAAPAAGGGSFLPASCNLKNLVFCTYSLSGLMLARLARLALDTVISPAGGL
jgi:hypothetical protein